MDLDYILNKISEENNDQISKEKYTLKDYELAYQKIQNLDDENLKIQLERKLFLDMLYDDSVLEEILEKGNY